jgi:toxin ParE1/3/4
LNRFVWLCESPSLWMPRQHIAKGLYAYPQQSHVIYFKKDDDTPDVIEIVRVLHGRMEPASRV